MAISAIFGGLGLLFHILSGPGEALATADARSHRAKLCSCQAGYHGQGLLNLGEALRLTHTDTDTERTFLIVARARLRLRSL